LYFSTTKKLILVTNIKEVLNVVLLQNFVERKQWLLDNTLHYIVF